MVLIDQYHNISLKAPLQLITIPLKNAFVLLKIVYLEVLSTKNTHGLKMVHLFPHSVTGDLLMCLSALPICWHTGSWHQVYFYSDSLLISLLLALCVLYRGNSSTNVWVRERVSGGGSKINQSIRLVARSLPMAFNSITEGPACFVAGKVSSRVPGWVLSRSQVIWPLAEPTHKFPAKSLG